MSKPPRITGEQAVRVFLRAGFVIDRVKGSHHILKRDGHPLHLSVPVHKGKTLGTGLLHKLIESAGMTPEQFYALL